MTMQELFAKIPFSGPAESNKKSLEIEVNEWSHEYIVGTSLEELVNYLVSEHGHEPIQIIEISHGGAQSIAVPFGEPVTHKVGTTHNFKQQPTRVKQFLDVSVSFEGIPYLLNCKPSVTMSRPFSAEIDSAEHLLRFKLWIEPDTDLKARLDEEIQLLNDWLGALASDIAAFKSDLKTLAEQIVSDRKKQAESVEAKVAQLTIPLVRREEPPRPPGIRRKAKVVKPAAKYDPVLEEKEYQHILDIIQAAARVFEMSPNSFVEMPEESLRDILLVTLNTHYQGRATGETFNRRGKTDIIIKEEDSGSNVFIAECKIWRGETAHKKALDQLIKNVTWRDTRTALIIFSKVQKFKLALERIQKSTLEHSHFISKQPQVHEALLRCRFGSWTDKKTEFSLAVLSFDCMKVEDRQE